MSKIKELVKLIETTKIVASSDPGNNQANYRVKLGKINKAKRDLEALFLEYRKVIQQNSVFIILTGSRAQMNRFTDIATEKFDCLTSNADDFYTKIADEIDPKLYIDKESSPALFDVMSSIFEDFALDLDIIGYPQLIFEYKYKRLLTSKKDLIDLIKDAFNDKIGAELVGLFTIDSVSRIAVNQKFDKDVCPIVLESHDQKLALELFNKLKNLTPNVFMVATGTNRVDENIINNSVATMKKALIDDVKAALIEISAKVNTN
jgi:hypothetical protein